MRARFPTPRSRALRKVERLLHQGMVDPAAVVSALRVEGRSPGATARLVDEFFTRTHLGSHLDEVHRRAEQRRRRRLDRLPDSLRPAVKAFTDYLIGSRTRAALVGAAGLADATIEARIADLAVLAENLTSAGITDWAAVSGDDIEAFLTASTGSRLASCRAFFAFARRRKIILVDPTGGITHKSPRGFAGRVLGPDQQRQLLRRWMRLDIDPRERLVGLLSLIHGAGGGVCPALLRQTRLADLTHQLDPRLVSATFGMTEGGALHYITDAVDDEAHVFRPHL